MYKGRDSDLRDQTLIPQRTVPWAWERGPPCDNVTPVRTEWEGVGARGEGEVQIGLMRIKLWKLQEFLTISNNTKITDWSKISKTHFSLCHSSPGSQGRSLQADQAPWRTRTCSHPPLSVPQITPPAPHQTTRGTSKSLFIANRILQLLLPAGIDFWHVV